MDTIDRQDQLLTKKKAPSSAGPVIMGAGQTPIRVKYIEGLEGKNLEQFRIFLSGPTGKPLEYLNLHYMHSLDIWLSYMMHTIPRSKWEWWLN